VAKNESKRIDPDILKSDLESLTAVKNLANYTPANADYALAKLEVIQGKMVGAQEAETVAKTAWDAARDDATAAEWALHNAILGVKSQVEAQYGKDSNEYQALGLKKKSEYKKPGRSGTAKA
jgi:hypothetical protein